MKFTDYESIAFIQISDGIVHLVASLNPDASCCQDDESGTIIQSESYRSDGWNEPKENPALADDFWGVWSDWNGRMCGGIDLDDDYTYDDADNDIEDWGEKVTPSQIKDLPDGQYVVMPE